MSGSFSPCLDCEFLGGVGAGGGEGQGSPLFFLEPQNLKGAWGKE